MRNYIKSAAPVALGLTILLLSAQALAQPGPEPPPPPAQICGDVVVTGTEDCEIGVPMTATCETLPGSPWFVAGVLGCTSGCTFDAAQCVVSICGNGFVEWPEVCDHDNATAFARCGRLCASDCGGYDETACPRAFGVWDEFTIFATNTNHSYPDETDPEEALAAVDAICQAKADGAGLVGTFRAWLSRDGLTASDRLLHANVPYVRTDGVQVADNWADLTDETLDAAISLDQNQDPVSGLAWTGTRSNGSLFGFQSCEPPAPPNSGLGRVGSVLATSVSEWTSLEARDCNESHHFYCIEHPAAPNLAPREMWTGIWEDAGSDQTIPYDGRIVRRSWPLAEFEAALPGLEAVGWRIRDVEVRWTGYLLFEPGELVADVILERGDEDEEFFEGSWEGFLVRHQAAQSEGRLLIDFEYVGLSNPAAAPNSVAAVWRGLGAYLIHDPLDWDDFMDRRDEWADSSYRLVDLEIRNDFGTSGESLFVGVYHYNFFAVPNYLLVGPEWDEFASLAMQLDDFKLVDIEVFEVWGQAASGEAIPHYAGVWHGTSDRDRFIGGQPWDRWVRSDELYRDLRLVPIDLDSHQGIPKAPPAFAGYLHDVLGPQSVGYSYGFTENGGETYGASGYARAPWEAVDDDPAIRMTPGKRMELASVAKSITGAAVLQAASEAGIAATVDEYLDLPFWDQIAPFFDSGMASTVDAGVASVSIRDVLRHRSGIGFGGGARCNDIINKLKPFLQMPLAGMPGQLPMVYQNYNYCIAHLLVEASSQWPHAAWVQDRLFRSVGIYGARNKPEESAPTLAYMLPMSAPGAPITNPGFTYTHDAVDEVGPNGWYMSAADLLRFYLAFDAADNVTAEVRNEAWSDVQGWFTNSYDTSRNFVGHNGFWGNGNTGRYTTAGLQFRVGQVGTLLVNSAPSGWNTGPPGWKAADWVLARAFEANWQHEQLFCGDAVEESWEICDGQPCCTSYCHTAAADTVCVSAQGACDLPDVCNGVDSFCPVSGVESAGTPCRDKASACDTAEQCDGVNPACPADAVESAGTQCRGIFGACDAAEQCDGVNPACPADAPDPAGTVCRPEADGCDVAEECTGASMSCPADAGKPDGDGDGTCDLFDQCPGFDDENPPDADSDGHCDAFDNCPIDCNHLQMDSDGDGIGDICDVCPAVTGQVDCDPDQSLALLAVSCQPPASVFADTVVTTLDGSVGLLVPANTSGSISLEEPTISITGGIDQTDLGFALNGLGGTYHAIRFGPPEAVFDPPLVVSFGWDDQDEDGIVDGTTDAEADFQIFRNGQAVTGRCAEQLCGSMDLDTGFPSDWGPRSPWRHGTTNACCEPEDRNRFYVEVAELGAGGSRSGHLLTEFVWGTVSSVCGDGLVEGTEACDDRAGNGAAASCCTAECTAVADGAVSCDGNACTSGDRCESGVCVQGDCRTGQTCTFCGGICAEGAECACEF